MATLDVLKGWAEDAVAGAPPGAVGAAAAIPAGLPAKPEPAAQVDDKEKGEDDDEEKTTPTPKGGKTGPMGAKLKPGDKKDVEEEKDKDATDDDVEVKEEADEGKDEGKDDDAEDGTPKQPPSTPSLDPGAHDPNPVSYTHLTLPTILLV